MKRTVKIIFVTLLMFFSSIGFSVIAFSPLFQPMMTNCAVDKLQDSNNLSLTLENTYNECSVLPQSLTIILAGVGLFLSLYLFRFLKTVQLKVSGMLLVCLFFVALELLFYVFFQHKYFYEAQLATTWQEVTRNYLFALSSLVSITLAFIAIPKIVGQQLFSKDEN